MIKTCSVITEMRTVVCCISNSFVSWFPFPITPNTVPWILKSFFSPTHPLYFIHSDLSFSSQISSPHFHRSQFLPSLFWLYLQLLCRTVFREVTLKIVMYYLCICELNEGKNKFVITTHHIKCLYSCYGHDSCLMPKDLTCHIFWSAANDVRSLLTWNISLCLISTPLCSHITSFIVAVLSCWCLISMLKWISYREREL